MYDVLDLFALSLIVCKPAAAVVAPAALLVAVNQYCEVALGLLVVAFGKVTQDDVL
jgi:hypothetical protein